MMSLSINH